MNDDPVNGHPHETTDAFRMKELVRVAKLYETLLSTTTDFAYIFDPQGRFLYANAQLLKVYAKPLDQVVGKSLHELGYPDWHAKMHMKEIQDIVRTKQSIRGEVPFTGESGIYGVYDYIFQPVLDASGQVEVIVGTTRDVTARHKTHTQLQFLAQLTQKLSSVADPLELNGIATREIGEFLGAHRCYFFNAYPDIHHARVWPDWCREQGPSIEGIYTLAEYGDPSWWAAVRKGPVSVDDVTVHPLTKDFIPNYQPLKIAAYSLSPFIHEGQWKACISVTSNVPRLWTTDEKSLLENAVARVWPLLERAQIEETLRKSEEALSNSQMELERLVDERTASLQEAVTQMEEFSYSVSHDLRAPLRAMQGYATALLEDYGEKIDEQGLEYLRHIASAGNRMDRLTRDVLVYSKIPRTAFKVHIVDLDKLVSDIVRQNLPDQSKDASIIIEKPLLSVLGNESFLAQSVSNLIDNAVKFASKGRSLCIRIRTERHDEQVRLWVEDNGIGILPEHQSRVWGMFERIHPQHLYEGTGIGLAIVRKTVERMNGTMGLESDGTMGSKFWIQLPGVSSNHET